MNNGDEKENKKIIYFTDLNAWKYGHNLVLEIYKITKSFPKEEIFGITNQMRRCAVSITSNIAEGFSRRSYKDKVQFYSIAQGSLTELQNQLIISRDINYIDLDKYNDLINKSTTVHKLITGLIKSSQTIIHSS